MASTRERCFVEPSAAEAGKAPMSASAGEGGLLGSTTTAQREHLRPLWAQHEARMERFVDDLHRRPRPRVTLLV